MATVGDTLREARAAKQYALEDVHARIGIPVHYLRALENGDGRLIADEFYLVPFLRRYAEFLEIDSVAVVARFLNEAVRRDDAHRTSRPVEGRPTLPASVGVAAAVLIVAVVVGWLLLSGNPAAEVVGSPVTTGSPAATPTR